MLRLNFKTLAAAYTKYNALDTAALYRELGWDDLINKPTWANTCAVRMSLALIENGVEVAGRITIKAGDLKGKRIEPGQTRLSDWLVTAHQKPQRYRYDPRHPAGPRELFGKRGIISFMRIPSYQGGHIDLLDASNDWLACSRACYFDATEVRFWPVP